MEKSTGLLSIIEDLFQKIQIFVQIFFKDTGREGKL